MLGIKANYPPSLRLFGVGEALAIWNAWRLRNIRKRRKYTEPMSLRIEDKYGEVLREHIPDQKKKCWETAYKWFT
jgi:hypothetical protein